MGCFDQDGTVEMAKQLKLPCLFAFLTQLTLGKRRAEACNLPLISAGNVSNPVSRAGQLLSGYACLLVCSWVGATRQLQGWWMLGWLEKILLLGSSFSCIGESLFQLSPGGDALGILIHSFYNCCPLAKVGWNYGTFPLVQWKDASLGKSCSSGEEHSQKFHPRWTAGLDGSWLCQERHCPSREEGVKQGISLESLSRNKRANPPSLGCCWTLSSLSQMQTVIWEGPCVVSLSNEKQLTALFTCGTASSHLTHFQCQQSH